MAEKVSVYFPTITAARKALVSLRSSYNCSEPTNGYAQGMPVKIQVTLTQRVGSSAYATALDRLISIASQCGGRIIDTLN